jgi:large subunit ribosomal protein L18
MISTGQKRREARIRRHRRVRQRVRGTAVRPRLAVYRSLKHIYAQVIDDEGNRCLVGVGSNSPEVREALAEAKGKVGVSVLVGKLVAAKALAAGIEQVAFDRGGYLYHGRVKALADGAREAGLRF